MKTLPLALLALLGLVLCACAAQAATGAYTLSTLSPPQVALDLASEPGARVFNATEMQPPTGEDPPTKVAIDVGDFSIDFYGDRITNFTLSFAGFIAFGEIYGNETANPSFPLSDCPFPSRPSKFNDFAFYQGLAFAWSEYNWFEGGHVAFKVYPAGSCPYQAKAAQACLVVQATVLPYYGLSAAYGLGNVTAFIFSSGDFLVQVNSSATGNWGNQRSDSVGVIFGIQDVLKEQGVTYPGEAFCNATAVAGWEAVTNATSLYPGQTFGFYITAPCPSGQVIRPDGLGCYKAPTSSAARSTAAWIDSIFALFL